MSCRKARHVEKPTCMGASHRDISWLKCIRMSRSLHSLQQLIELLKCIKYHPLGGPFPHTICTVRGRANQWMLPNIYSHVRKEFTRSSTVTTGCEGTWITYVCLLNLFSSFCCGNFWKGLKQNCTSMYKLKLSCPQFAVEIEDNSSSNVWNWGQSEPAATNAPVRRSVHWMGCAFSFSVIWGYHSPFLGCWTLYLFIFGFFLLLFSWTQPHT